MKSQYSKTQLSFLLIRLLCQIFKLCFTAKAIPAFVSVYRSHDKTLSTLSIRKLGHENQKSNHINRLPSMIFRCFHSRDSQLHNKCYFCSIKIIFISKIPQFVWRIMFRNPQEKAVTTTQTNSKYYP